ncbi:MAG: capsular polysaccharide biosynthesis protein [Gammaproteobacteria bacterium]|nr:capsular polysaccharide biosynthesis protein [Gammaproteobacteria bacterium]
MALPVVSRPGIAVPENRACGTPADQTVVVAFSHGLRKIRHLESFLQCKVIPESEARDTAVSVTAVIVWGRKKTTLPALEYANANHLPVWYIEDGWIRSASENAHSRLSYSLLVDRQGVYYDPETPSEIETLLNLSDTEFAELCSPQDLNRARQCRTTLVQHNITKYNYCKTADFSSVSKSNNLVLVIDQTLDDASVICGGMNAEKFCAMLDAAIVENPDAQVVVRTHPDVVAGIKQGYLSDYARRRDIPVLSGGDNPMAWVKRAQRVYTGTSQLGYEALLAGTSVSVFGKPFYAGWGLTDDRLRLTRRVRARTIDQMFYISHMVLARYCNPVTGSAWTLEECLEHVQLQQAMFQRNKGKLYCVGITAWKRAYVKQYLRSPDGEVQFGSLANLPADAQPVTWGFRQFANPPISGRTSGRQSPQYSTDLGPTLAQSPQNSTELGPTPVPNSGPTRMPQRIEDGFLRSTGLGSDFTAPGSLVVDQTGLYFDPSQPSDLETLLNEFDCQPKDIHRAVRLRQHILKSGISKYNIGETSQLFESPVDKKCVLVVGQVEDDQSVQRGCELVNTNQALLEAVRFNEPNAWIIYKPHPDVEAGNRKGIVATEILDRYADCVDRYSNIANCLDQCDELHTMTSLAGFEALMRGKKVVTYGAPFYAGWGLTNDKIALPTRRRNRTLDELVFMVLIQYPRYVDIETGEFTTPENLISRIEQLKNSAADGAPKNWVQRTLNKVVNIYKGVRYAP